jgi:hypothetical protein
MLGLGLGRSKDEEVGVLRKGSCPMRKPIYERICGSYQVLTPALVITQVE